MHGQPASRFLTLGDDPGGHLVTVKLTSIEHSAARGDQVAEVFDFQIYVSDGGRNETGQITLNNQSLSPGSKITPNQQIFIGEYGSLSVGAIKFDFTVFGDGEFGVFSAATEGDDQLHPGVQHFVAPVVLEKANGDRSTLIYRGRIDLV